jgi:anti-sigma regulatory factor (Ser/Thr protein kinase)
MAKPSRYSELVRTITTDVVAHPRDLSRYYVESLGVSRVTATKYIQKLEAEGWIARSGPSTHPVFSPGYLRTVVRVYPLGGLDEFAVWERDFRPYFTLAPNVLNIVSHGFTEMVNNAVDHSDGRLVLIYATQRMDYFALGVSDDGMGIFSKITQALSLPDKRQALLELAKGKLTTDPSKHSGEGIFFTSRMFDSFQIEADDLEYVHDLKDPQDWLHDAKPFEVKDGGTTVVMHIALNSTRTATEVYDQYTNAPDDFNFSKTVVPMRLAVLGDEQLISRSQAKRLIARFDRFRTVVLDFTDVHEVGQAFADELFRVYAKSHPSVELVPTNMSRQVEGMHLRAIAPRPD